MRKLIPVLALAVLATSLMVFIGCSEEEDPVTPPPPCSIELTAPVAGSTFYTGDLVNIRWNTSGTPSTVDVELVSGDLDTLIAPGTANTGYYPWTIQAYGYGSRHNYQVRVTGVGDEACTDTTDQFSIVSLSGCSIGFVYDVKDSIPTQTAGDTYTIQWTSNNTSGELVLELWTTSPWPAYTPQTPVFTIDPSTPDDQSYDWEVSSFNFSENAMYRFRLTDTHWGTCQATSVPFRIIDNAVCTIGVTGIPSGATYNPGEQVAVMVDMANETGLVSIDLFHGSNPVTNGHVADHDPTTGPYMWTVNDYGDTSTPNSAYRLVATSKEDRYCSGRSEQFTITR